MKGGEGGGKRKGVRQFGTTCTNHKNNEVLIK